MSPTSFYSRVFDTAKNLGATDTQAHLAASQASQETGYGKHVVGNNFFGIKAPSNAANAVNAQTQESVDGKMVNTNASFRSFKGLEDAVAGYMNTMAQSFPAAWNAPTLSEAVSNLSNGIFGKYATDPNYESKVANIADKYGKYAYAQNPENVPVPSNPNDPEFANSLQAQEIDGLSGVLNPAIPTPVTREDIAAPATLGPAQNNFASLAAAGPFSAPMDASATGSIGMTPGLAGETDIAMGAPSTQVTRGMLAAAAMPNVSGWDSMAAAGPMGVDLAQQAAFSGDPVQAAMEGPYSANGLTNSITSQSAVPSTAVTSIPTPTAAIDSAFGANGMMTGAFPGEAPVAATPDPSRMMASDGTIGRLMATPQAINPSMPAMNSFADLAAAGPISAPADTGINSAAFQGVADQAQQNLAAMQEQPSYSAPAVAAQPTNSFSDLAAAAPFSSALANGYAEQASVPAGISAINAVAPQTPTGVDPSVAAGYQQFAATATPAGITNLSGNTLVGPMGTAVSNFDAPAASVPSLETATVADQPSIAGPANTAIAPAVQQQQTQAISTAAAPTSTMAGTSGNAKQGMLGGLLNKGTLAGGLLGGLVAGPLGGLLGGFLGNQIAKNGGLGSMFGGQQMDINNIGAGLANTSSVYGGAPAGTQAGTQADTNNGGNVTSLGGGWTAYTNPNGVVSTEGPNNLHASYFGPSLTDHTSGRPSGGGGGGGYT